MLIMFIKHNKIKNLFFKGWQNIDLVSPHLAFFLFLCSATSVRRSAITCPLCSPLLFVSRPVTVRYEYFTMDKMLRSEECHSI